ncbi:DUF2637 domain-containing protein [Streptomonospora litoralis]|uniref:Helix-turn-helix type 11 domain-containing protein n=1 Tax=Streptomonospora litoralis TaxID=2498135 RepID=A0A4P6Q7B5_9ACTN|nr:DUF2637 domain-containing protein [Streptomonospora litoralis]QBI56645.1 hypothetical protein EKD16_24505 [Streptomonospora litoralis]
MPAWMSHVPWWVIAAAAVVLVVAVIAGLRALLARRATRPTAGGSGLHSGYLVATVLIASAALMLILVAFTMSYAALYESATWLADTQLTAINGGDLRFLFPLGIDAVIVYFLAMDLVMEWQGRRHPLNRWSAYGLSAITIVLNVAQGEGTTSSYLGHAGPPVVIILIAEGVAAWVRHLAGLAHGGASDRIPFGRWLAHPLSTLKVARLMLGSGITSYPDALEREQQRQLAYAMLREQYARRWRRATPRHLKWMLDNGYDLPTAFTIIRAMTASRVAMTAAEARSLLGEPADAPAPAPQAADRPVWRAAEISESYAAAPARRAARGRRTAADAGPADGGPAEGAARGTTREQPRDDRSDQGDRGYTPVLFQEPGPAPWPPRGEEAAAAPDVAARVAANGAAHERTGNTAAPERTVPSDAAIRAAEAQTGPPRRDESEPAAEAEPPAEPEPAAAPAREPRTEPAAPARSGLEPEPTPEADYAPEPQPAPEAEAQAAPDAQAEEEIAEPAPRRPPVPRISSQERRQQVRNLLETVPDISADEIAGHLGLSPRTVRRYLQEIIDTASGDGDYRIEEGEDGQPRMVQTAYGA